MKRTRSNRCYDNKFDEPSRQIIDSYHLALATPKNQIHIINPVDGRIEKRLKGHTGHTQTILTLLVLSRGRLASMSYDGIRVWNLLDDSFVEFKGNMHIQYAPMVELSKTQVIFQKREAQHFYPVIIWDHYTNQIIELRGHTKRITWMELLTKSPQISPKHLVATASQDGSVRIWDTVSGTQLYAFYVHVPVAIVHMIELQDGRLAFTTKTGAVYVWRFWTDHAQDIQYGMWIHCKIYLNQLTTGQLVMYGEHNYGVKLAKIINDNRATITTIDHNPCPVAHVLEHDNWVISHSMNNISFYNLQTRQQIEYTVNRITRSMLISNDRLVLGSRYQFISVWDMNHLDAEQQSFHIPFAPLTIRELRDGRLLICSETKRDPIIPKRQCCILDLLTGAQMVYTTTSNVPTVLTKDDRQTCYDHVRDIFKNRLFPDLCDIISECLVGHRLCNLEKRQKTK